MEYKIVKVSGDIDNEFLNDELEIQVNEEIKNGWKPLGGINIISLRYSGLSANFIEAWQPMIKEK